MKGKKKILIIIGVVLILIIAGVLIIMMMNKKKQSINIENTTQAVENQKYEMYVKINPLVKLIFEQVYEECKDVEGNKYACAEPSFNVVDYELVNNDAKNIYKELDFFGVSLNDALIMLCDTAKDKNIDFNQVELTTDYNNFNTDNIMNDIKNGSKYHSEFNVLINVKEVINKDDLLTEEEKNEPKEFSAIFNSDGGSKVTTQIIKEGGKVVKPANPTKAGYYFISWQKDGKDYNFDEEVKEDLKLIAKWERNGEETTTKSTKITTTTTTKATQATDPHKGYINLNDKVLYVDQSFCSWYVYVKPECVNKTIAELAAIYPNHEPFPTDPEDYFDINEKLDLNSSWLDGYKYFPACQANPPQSAINKFNSTAGYKCNVKNGNIHIESIGFQNDKYDKYKTYNPFAPSNFIAYGGCGGGGYDDVTWLVLDESKCNYFNFKCDRW